MVYTEDGEFLCSWGETGYSPGQFRSLHALAMDDEGQLYVVDRANNRVQIFRPNGTFVAQWTHFGRPSGIFFDDHGKIYVSDSESDNIQNPGYEMGIRNWRRQNRMGALF